METTEGDAALENLAISINLWFDFSPRLDNPHPPLAPSLLLELSRHVEFHLATIIGALSIPPFLEACLLELVAPDDPTAAARADVATASQLPRLWLVMRNALFSELAVCWLGWGGLRRFFEDLLHPQRYRGLQSYEPEMLGETP